MNWFRTLKKFILDLLKIKNFKPPQCSREGHSGGRLLELKHTDVYSNDDDQHKSISDGNGGDSYYDNNKNNSIRNEHNHQPNDLAGTSLIKVFLLILWLK